MKVLRCLGTVLPLVMLWPLNARAEPTAWLSWAAPPECPTAQDIEQRVDGLLGGALPESLDLAAQTSLSWTGGRWEVSVNLRVDGHSGRRQVAVSTCSEAAEFVAVAVALALEPTLAGTVATAPSEQETHRESLEVEPAEAEGAPPVAKLAPERAAPVRPAAARSWTARPHLSGALDLGVGVLPEPRLGPALALGVDLERLTVSLGGRWLPAATTASARAVAPLEFSLLDARLLIAYRFLGPNVQIGPILSLNGGVIYAEQQTPGAELVREPWAALGAGVMGGLAVHSKVRVFSEFEVGLPLTRPRFVLSDGSEIHRVRYGVRAQLGARIFFTN